MTPCPHPAAHDPLYTAPRPPIPTPLWPSPWPCSSQHHRPVSAQRNPGPAAAPATPCICHIAALLPQAHSTAQASTRPLMLNGSSQRPASTPTRRPSLQRGTDQSRPRSSTTLISITLRSAAGSQLTWSPSHSQCPSASFDHQQPLIHR